MQQDVALQRDAEIGLAVAVHVARNDGVAIAEAFAQLALLMAEITATDKAKGVVQAARLGVDKA